MALWSPAGIVESHCPHRPEDRHQCYEHGWFCRGCARFFYGLTSDNPPKLIPDSWKPGGEENRRRREEHAASLREKGIMQGRGR